MHWIIRWERLKEDASGQSASDVLADKYEEFTVAGGFGVLKGCAAFKMRDATSEIEKSRTESEMGDGEGSDIMM